MSHTNTSPVSATGPGTSGQIVAGPMSVRRRAVERTATALSSLLLATLLSALILLADRLVDAWFAGGLLVAVLVLWLVLFVGLVLFGRLASRFAWHAASSLHARPQSATAQTLAQYQGSAARAGLDGLADAHAVLARSGQDRLTNRFVLLVLAVVGR